MVALDMDDLFEEIQYLQNIRNTAICEVKFAANISCYMLCTCVCCLFVCVSLLVHTEVENKTFMHWKGF